MLLSVSHTTNCLQACELPLQDGPLLETANSAGKTDQPATERTLHSPPKPHSLCPRLTHPFLPVAPGVWSSSLENPEHWLQNGLQSQMTVPILWWAQRPGNWRWWRLSVKFTSWGLAPRGLTLSSGNFLVNSVKDTDDCIQSLLLQLIEMWPRRVTTLGTGK